jgi:hypothetical protein
LRAPLSPGAHAELPRNAGPTPLRSLLRFPGRLISWFPGSFPGSPAHFLVPRFISPVPCVTPDPHDGLVSARRPSDPGCPKLSARAPCERAPFGGRTDSHDRISRLNIASRLTSRCRRHRSENVPPGCFAARPYPRCRATPAPPFAFTVSPGPRLSSRPRPSPRPARWRLVPRPPLLSPILEMPQSLFS